MSLRDEAENCLIEDNTIQLRTLVLELTGSDRFYGGNQVSSIYTEDQEERTRNASDREVSSYA